MKPMLKEIEGRTATGETMKQSGFLKGHRKDHQYQAAAQTVGHPICQICYDSDSLLVKFQKLTSRYNT